MKRTLILSSAVLIGWLGWVSASQAQVFVRAPFVRVYVGGDGAVGVRAPFVNFFLPPAGPINGPVYGPVYRPLYGPPIVTLPSTPPPLNVAPLPPGQAPFTGSAPQPVPPVQ